LSGHSIEFQQIDIADPIYEEDKAFMIENSKENAKGLVLTPQIFKDDEYCGDYRQFEEAIENEELFQFLKLAPPKPVNEPEQVLIYILKLNLINFEIEIKKCI
jgi:SH3 domain-binding glutamic acid-rich protein